MTLGDIHLVISVLGDDHPGIVDVVTRWILNRGGNIVESHMAVLGGEFGAMFLVSASENAARAIEAEVDEMSEREELRAIAKRTSAPHLRPHPGALAYRLIATSLDHPGIVNRISHLLAEKGINIEVAVCAARPGPWSGAPVFHLEMTLAIPEQSAVKSLREALEQLSDEEGIDIELRAVSC
jgi:glycine cleavage system transcriptional repressor